MPRRCRLLIVLASVLALLGLLGAWVDRQLLNTDDWTTTSGALLRDDQIRTPVADAIAGQVADGSQVTSALGQALPPKLALLAPQAGALVREAAQRATERLLDAPRVQKLWQRANRLTHQQLVDLVEGKDKVLTKHGIVIDLRPLSQAISKRGGFGGHQPRSGGRIVLLEPDQVQTLQTAGDVLDTLAWLPGLLSLALYGLAVWLAGSHRRRAVLVSGLSLIGIGLLCLVVRRLAGHELVHAVAGDGPYVPTASAVWRIATSLLAELVTVVVVVGAAAASGAWLAGPGPRATRMRSRIAPTLRDQPGAVMGLTAVGYLVLLAWGPLAVLRRPWPIVVFGVLALTGVWTLHRQAVRELAAAP